MDRTRLRLVGMTAAIATIAVALAFMPGRQSAPEPAPVNKAATAPPSTTSGPTPAAASDPAATHWLAGGWAEESTSCQTDTGDYYDPGGRYGRAGAEGHWRVEGGQLVVTITHEAVGDPLAEEYIGLPEPETKRSRITRQGPNRMVQVIDGRPVRMMRCPSARRSFAT